MELLRKNSRRWLSLVSCFLPFIGCLVLLSSFPISVNGIRKDIGFQWKQMCKSTVQGRYLLSDDNGRVCNAFSINSWTQCCPEAGEKFLCQGCNLVSQCCNSYEYCVSCCLDPARTKPELALKMKIAKPITAGTYQSVFDFCAGRCRHSSASVVHENAYASEFHHCFSLQMNSSVAADTNIESKLAGINVIVGRQGESCSLVCKSVGQSCVPAKLLILNKCEIMQKYMNCSSGCVASIGADQPAEVVDHAPKDLNPGACLYTDKQSVLSCDGSHPHTKRLCPCA
ncbi:uncharacterized protein LOC116251286 [Nymphaea colorata]|nr:uncharacterized protein LOC116251286 [Nymphaea colorata]